MCLHLLVSVHVLMSSCSCCKGLFNPCLVVKMVIEHRCLTLTWTPNVVDCQENGKTCGFLPWLYFIALLVPHGLDHGKFSLGKKQANKYSCNSLYVDIHTPWLHMDGFVEGRQLQRLQNLKPCSVEPLVELLRLR